MRIILFLLLFPFLIILIPIVGALAVGLGAGIFGVIVGILGAIFGVIVAIFAAIFGGLLSFGGFFLFKLAVFVIIAMLVIRLLSARTTS